jgi:hypothetical protein
MRCMLCRIDPGPFDRRRDDPAIGPGSRPLVARVVRLTVIKARAFAPSAASTPATAQDL